MCQRQFAAESRHPHRDTPASAVIAIDTTTFVRGTMAMTCMHSRTCLHSTPSRQSVKVTAMRPHRAASHHSSASPAGLSRHAVRQSGRCRAADSGGDEQGEPQQQLKQVTEDVKQQAEEATQGTWDSRRSYPLAGPMCMCLLISWLTSQLAWPLRHFVLHNSSLLDSCC